MKSKGAWFHWGDAAPTGGDAAPTALAHGGLVGVGGVLLLLWAVGPAAGQLITDVSLESEEDVSEALEEGAIDSEQRDELLALLRDPVELNRGDLTRLAVVPGVTPNALRRIEDWRFLNDPFLSVADLAKVPGIDPEPMRAFVYVALERGPRGTGVRGFAEYQATRDLRLAGDFRDDLIMDITAEGHGAGTCRVRARVRDEEDDQAAFQERSLVYTHGGSSLARVVVGNVSEPMGLGVTLGRRVTLSKSLRTPGDSDVGFWAPRLGRYNGLFARGRTDWGEPYVLWSENRYADLSDRVVAGGWDWRAPAWDLGGLVSRQTLDGRLSGDRFQRDFLALHGRATLGLLDVLGESSWSPDHGLGTELRFEAQGAIFQSAAVLWRYGRDYVNVHGGGTADVDRVAIEVLPEDEIAVRDRFAGEQGALLETDLFLGRGISIEAVYARWFNVIDAGLDQRGALQMEWRATSRRRVSVRQFWDLDNLDGDVSGRWSFTVDGRSNVGRDVDLRLRGILRGRDSVTAASGEVRSLDLRLEASFRRVAPLAPWVRIRWVDGNLDQLEDGYAEVQIEEKVHFLERYTFKVRVRSRHYQGIDRPVDPDTEARVSLRVGL